MKEDKQIRTSRPRGGGPGRGLAPGEKPQNLRKAIADIVRYMGGYRLVVALVMLLAAASTVFQVIGPKVMGMATPRLELETTPAGVTLVVYCSASRMFTTWFSWSCVILVRCSTLSVTLFFSKS